MFFQFTYSSYPSFYIDITLNNNQLTFKEKYGSEGNIITLSEQKVSEFWSMIKMIRLDFWKENYSSCILDGLQWNLKIESDFMSKDISGTNEYPDGSCDLKYTPVFDKLTSAVEYLISENGFFKNL